MNSSCKHDGFVGIWPDILCPTIHPLSLDQGLLDACLEAAGVLSQCNLYPGPRLLALHGLPCNPSGYLRHGEVFKGGDQILHYPPCLRKFDPNFSVITIKKWLRLLRRVEFRKTSTMGIYSLIPSRIFALIYFNIKIRILHSRKVFSFASEWEIF